jgi:hypothetical protein
MSTGVFHAHILRPAVRIEWSSAGELVVAFPRGVSSEDSPPVCVGATQSTFSINFPPGSAGFFAVEFPVDGKHGGRAFHLPAGRDRNPVVSFPSGGKIVIASVPTGPLRFEKVAITSPAGSPGASMDPLPAEYLS